MNSKSRTGKTAIELMKELQQKTDFRERERLREIVDESSATAYREAAQGVIGDLRDSGFNVSTVGELRSVKRYRKAIPVLVKWLRRVQNIHLKEDIVRTLSVPWAKPEVGPILVSEYKATSPQLSGLRWAIANALEVVAAPEIFDDLVELVREVGGGQARQMLVIAIAKTETSRRIDVLLTRIMPDVAD